MSSSHNNCTADKPHRKEKVEKTFFDTNFFSDPKIELLINEFGAEVVSYYLKIALAILSEGGEIHIRIAKSFLSKLGADDACIGKFLEACIDVDLLYVAEDGKHYRSRRADREIEGLHEKREKWRAKQGKQRCKGETPPPVPGVSPGTPGRHPVDSEEEEEREEEQEPEREPEREPEPRITGRKPKKVPPYRAYSDSDFVFPPKWGHEATEALAQWVAYKSLAGHPALLTSYQAQVKHFANNPAFFVQLVDRAIREGWQGLNEHARLPTKGAAPTASGFSAAHQHNLDLIRRAEEAENDQG